MQRVILAILACFWAFMGYRLWQVEYAGKGLGAAVDIEVVWNKILNAQDEAPLSIVSERNGEAEALGWMMWSPTVTRGDTDKYPEVEGMVRTALGYSLNVDRGRIFGTEHAVDFNFSFHIGFGPDPERAWTNVRLNVRQQNETVDYNVRLDAQSTNTFFSLNMESIDTTNQTEIAYADLRKPDKLVHAGMELAGVNPLITAGTTLAIRNLMGKTQLAKSMRFKFQWPKQAHYDLLPGVRTHIKVYRVDVPIVEDMLLKIYINPLGEILRVEIPDILIDTLRKSAKLNLPQSIVLRNDHFYGRLRRNRR
jgi:hypothetical protein|tara:strand:+ start:1248 stop:2171 length:924 start_codon:yes stop_codon:yes gene_type:complete